MTKELELWKGEFGDQYRERNEITDENMNARVGIWSNNFQAISMFGTEKGLPKSVLEVGCGAGINLLAIEKIYRANGEMFKPIACEPNAQTREAANQAFRAQNFFPNWANDTSDALNLELPMHCVDLAFTSGVLIHIHPDNQLIAMKHLYNASRKYIICMEYFSPALREINYHEEKALWTRDYGSLWLDNFNVRCLTCNFYWKRMSKLDNLTVWIFEKVN